MNCFSINVGKSLSLAALALAGLSGVAVAADQPVTTAHPVNGKIVDSMTNEASGVAGTVTVGHPFDPRGPGNACAINAATCQERAGANILVVNEPRSSNRSIASFTVADNFQISANANLTSICFWGYYGPTAPPAVGNEGFHIVLYTNANGVPSSIVATWDVGANFLTADTLTPGTTLTRSAPLGVPSSLAGTQIFAWTATVPAQALTAGTGYWLEISSSSATDNNNRWRWIDATSAPTGEQVCLQAPSANNGTYAFSNIVNSAAADRAFCLGLSNPSAALVVCNCQIPPVVANNSCGTAIALTAPANVTSANFRSALTTTPFCGTSAVATATLWYKTTGDGTTFTADTCGAGTDAALDTVINVYCSTVGCPTGSCTTACGTSNTGLFCVANNDDSNTCAVGSLHSSVSWPTVAGRQYIIAVFTYSNQNPSVGNMQIALTSNGTQSGNTAACVSDRCPVSLTGITVETDACGVSTNSACDGAGVGQFVLGTAFGGTSYNSGNARDFDFWHFNGVVPNTTGAGTTWYLTNYAVEFPGLMVFYSGTCAAGAVTQLGAAIADYRAFNGQCGVRGILVEATAGVDFFVNPIINEFGGVPCAAGNNNYSITVTAAAVGSCCQPAINCVVNPQSICTATAGAVWTANGTCTPDPCSGVCCTGTVCSLTSFDGCAGGTFTAAGTACTPNPCAPAGVCCRGATCTSTITTAGACTATGTAGAFFATSSGTCNVGNVSNAPCCYADYNKTGGVTVTDIFNFLSDWFAASPFARTGGNGDATPLTVQNIFDFLTNWFNGCAP